MDSIKSFDDPAFSGDRWAALFDDLTGGPDPTEAVEFLASLAPPGSRLLELGIGGGRMALPLAKRGFQVEGIEASGAVAQRLRRTPGAERIQCLVGDMADVAVEGPFAIVYLVWNGLFNLTHQQRQVECLKNIARVLADDGLVVLECFVPCRGEFSDGVHAREVSETSATITITKHDALGQLLTRQHITFTTDEITMMPVALRYCWPSEIDLMAALSGLELQRRFGDWMRAPFEASSSRHVSIYRKRR